MSSDSNVRQLLDAERDANKIIQAAHEERQVQIKKARNEAEEEVKAYRKQEEERFQAEIKKRFGDDTEENDLKKKTEEEIKVIHQAYDQRKGQVIDLLIERVMNVQLEIPQVVKRALTNKD
mmetsp:Transcript_32761/g.29636  ORF Transcript_32761/g.29636 Transcript_32761/m.29636 type:complete len:121 (+) Transcript_32761:64-426(+)